MHPLTKARVDAQAEVGRRLAAYAEASRLLGERIVSVAFVERRKDEYQQALQRLVEAAQAEGAGDDAS
jgi:hypothetical protein